MNEDSSADESPVRSAVKPAITNEKITDGPARPVATPKSTKIPVPIMAPIPMLAAPQTPRLRFNSANVPHHTNQCKII